jgi:hypothetical protein
LSASLKSFPFEGDPEISLNKKFLDILKPQCRTRKKVTQCTIRIPNEIMEKVDAYCVEHYISRSSWFVLASIKIVEMMEEVAQKRAIMERSQGEKDVSQNENV